MRFAAHYTIIYMDYHEILNSLYTSHTCKSTQGRDSISVLMLLQFYKYFACAHLPGSVCTTTYKVETILKLHTLWNTSTIYVAVLECI